MERELVVIRNYLGSIKVDISHVNCGAAHLIIADHQWALE
jgi:hypothetical protein